MKKVLFITNQAPYYRIPLFNRLSEELDIKFLFTRGEERIKGLKANYEYLPGIGFGKYKIHFSLINKLRKEDYNEVVLLPADPLHTIDNLIISTICKNKKKPYICTVGKWDYKNSSLKHKLTDPIYKKILNKAHACVVYGSKSKEWLLKQGIKNNKIFVAYNINPEIYENLNKTKKKLEIKGLKDKKVILFVGRLIKRKGVDYLIKAFHSIKDKKDIVLVIIGGGDFYKLGAKSEEYELKKLVKNLNLEKNVIFTGELTPKETKKYYSICDIFVCPSITTDIGEPWGHIIEEATSYGKPIIATDAVGAAYDLIQNNKNGLIIKEKNIQELKRAIEKILSNKKLNDDMGKKSLKIIKQKIFSFNTIINTWKKALK